MDIKVLILITCASFSEIGYSLLAPLYPFIAKEHNLSDVTIGLIFSTFAISNFIGTLSTPYWVQNWGRENFWNISIIIEGVCTFSFGLVSYISDPFTFTVVSFIIRFFQGAGSAICATWVYSLTAANSSEKNIEKNIGLIEFGRSIGVGLGPWIASIGYYFFGFEFPFFFCGVLEIALWLVIPKLEIVENNPDDNSTTVSVFQILKNGNICFTFLAVMVDMISLSFIYPVFSMHINQVYNLSPEKTSLLFIVETVVYFISIQFLDKINKTWGNRLTIVLGTWMNAVFILLVAPNRFAPQNLWVIMIGLGGLGLSGALVSIPAVINLIDTMKEEMGIEEHDAQDYSSAIFNWGFFLGETGGPLMGGILTNKYGFEVGCNYNSVFNCLFGVLYGAFILSSISEGQNKKRLVNPKANGYRQIGDEGDKMW